MKVKLFGLAALIFLSAISSIFNAMPMIGVSAQDYRTIDDNDSYGNNNNGMVESYSYEEPNIYNTDDSYSNFDPSIGEQNSEYSNYDNSYGPPTPDYGDGNAEYSNYDNSYGPPTPDYGDGNAEYSSYDNSYGPPTPDYGDGNAEYSSYDNFGYPPDNYYEEGSYDSNYYPPMKPKKFTCPDSGLVVDKPESCPVICPVGSTLQGHFVAAGSNLTQICNVDKQVLETCGPDTDLRGVFVTDATPEQCNIFATCDASTPLGKALDLTGTEIVEVADAQLCGLDVPTPPQIFTCPSEPTEAVPFLNSEMAGEKVTSLELCQVATPAVLCQAGTPLNGTWVNPNSTATCNIEIPPPQEIFQCDADDPLGEALGLTEDETVNVVDPQLCELSVPQTQIFVCPSEPNRDVPFPNSNMAGENVTSLELCQVATPAVLCPVGTPLNGTWVNPNSTKTCNIEIPEAIDLDVCPARSPENPNVNPDLEGALVTDKRLCEAPTAPNICPKGTDLAGVYANITATDTTACDIDGDGGGPITQNLQAQCLKCADLAVFNAANFPAAQTTGTELRGSTTNNIFTVCDDENPRSGFNALIAGGCTGLPCPRTSPTQNPTTVETAFDTCLDNAGVEPGNGTSSLTTQALSLQENSLTTNVEPQAEIPTVSESFQELESALQENSITTNVQPQAETQMSPPSFSPPTIAQGTEKSSTSSEALEKMTKLKQQWLDLLQ